MVHVDVLFDAFDVEDFGFVSLFIHDVSDEIGGDILRGFKFSLFVCSGVFGLEFLQFVEQINTLGGSKSDFSIGVETIGKRGFLIGE